MRLVLPLLLLQAAAPTALRGGEFARGMTAVGERPTDAIALRQATAPSPSFRLGAAYRAWRNAGAAVAHDAASSTGDGGDVELLAEDCADERIAFTSVETEREALRLAPEQVAAATGIAPDIVSAWQARRTRPPAHCRR